MTEIIRAREPLPVPEGCHVIESDERVGIVATSVTRWGIRRVAKKHPPLIGTTHYRIERVRFLRWELVAYQNLVGEIK